MYIQILRLTQICRPVKSHRSSAPETLGWRGWVQNVISSQSCRQASTFIRWIMSWWIIRAEPSIREASALISDDEGSNCILQKHIDRLRSIYSSSAWRFTRSTLLRMSWRSLLDDGGNVCFNSPFDSLLDLYGLRWPNEWEPTWTFTRVLDFS